MATTVEDILDKHCFSATDEREKGDRLQRMMVQFFTTDVVYADGSPTTPTGPPVELSVGPDQSVGGSS